MTFIDNLTKLTACIAAIVALATAIIALTSIGRYRDKIDSATFSFWSQLRFGIISLHDRLDANHAIIKNMYRINGTYDTTNSPLVDELELEDFYQSAAQLLKKIETADNQVPVYIGWTSDFTELVKFLIDVQRYDIRKTDEKFKKTYNITTDIDQAKADKEMNECVKEILRIMDELQIEIGRKQEQIEEKISRPGVINKKTKGTASQTNNTSNA